jgi:hypothetical protein
LSKRLAIVCATWIAACAAACAAAAEVQTPRIELRSPEYLLVGLLHGDSMSVRLTNAFDNAPVHDAALTAYLRGENYPLSAQVDGSYLMVAKDLALPGSASIEFEIKRGAELARLRGRLQTPDAAPKNAEQNNVRQYAWWVLNFAVCITAYVLFTRRRKTDET